MPFFRFVMLATLFAGTAPGLLLASPPASGATFEPGSSANRYVAGAQVSVDSPVAGDLLAVGGQVDVQHPVGADAAVAGGTVTIRADVGEDVRAAGGNVRIERKVGGELFAAGGMVVITESAAVTGPVVLAGNEVNFNGRAGQGIRIYASSVNIGGQVDGDATLYGREIALAPGARINGNLTYASPRELTQAELAVVTGNVVREATPEGLESTGGRTPDQNWFHPAFYISMLVTGIVLLWLFPHAAQAAGNAIRQAPGRSLLVGLLVLCALPPAAVLLIVTLVGLPIGLALLALYPVLLLLSWLATAIVIAQRIADAANRPFGLGLLRQAVFLALALLLLNLALLIPFAGPVLFMLALFAGAGGWAVSLYRRYNQTGLSTAPTAPVS